MGLYLPHHESLSSLIEGGHQALRLRQDCGTAHVSEARRGKWMIKKTKEKYRRGVRRCRTRAVAKKQEIWAPKEEVKREPGRRKRVAVQDEVFEACRDMPYNPNGGDDRACVFAHSLTFFFPLCHDELAGKSAQFSAETSDSQTQHRRRHEAQGKSGIGIGASRLSCVCVCVCFFCTSAARMLSSRAFLASAWECVRVRECLLL